MREGGRLEGEGGRTKKKRGMDEGDLFPSLSPGGFQNLDVLITQDGDVIYKLRLRGRMNTPVNLLLMYTRIGARARGEGEASVVNRTSLATFNATDRISNIEFSSQVPFRRFQVGVALMSGFTIGPINQSARNFGERTTVSPMQLPIGLSSLTVQQ